MAVSFEMRRCGWYQNVH